MDDQRVDEEVVVGGGGGGGGGGGAGMKETPARKPHGSGKRPLIFHGLVHL